MILLWLRFFYIILQYCSAKFVYVTLTPLATIAFTILTAFVAIYLPAINPAWQMTQHLIKKHVSFNKPEEISQLKFCKAITLMALQYLRIRGQTNLTERWYLQNQLERVEFFKDIVLVVSNVRKCPIKKTVLLLQANCLIKIKLIFTPGRHVLVAKETTLAW